MKVYIIVVDKDIPLRDLTNVLVDHNATGQIVELDGADGYNIRKI